MGEAGLTAVTFDELADLIRCEIDRGYDQTEKQDGRRLLLDVVVGLAATVSDDSDHLLRERTWRMAEVRMAGIGGIATLSPAALTFAPTSGMTIVRGPNGHGKTSLARGIDCGLRGERDMPDEVAGELWTADLLTEGVTAATIEVTLVSGPDRLAIYTEFAGPGSPGVTATLTDSAGTRPVEVGPVWRRALLSARACYNYGALQSRLTENRALQGYLEELLILGPAWDRVRTEVTSRGDHATQAKKALERGRRTAVSAEKSLAERFAVDDREPAHPEPLLWPQIGQVVDVDAWLRVTGLDSVEAPRPIRVEVDHEDRVAELTRNLQDADASLAQADQALHTPGMATALHHIERLMAVDDLEDATCPLCGVRTDWRGHAQQLIIGVQGRKAAVEKVRAVVSGLSVWVEATLVPMLDAGIPGGPDAEVAALRQAAVDGHHPHSAAHTHARSLLAVLSADGYSKWVSRLRAASDATAEWRAALSGVVLTFAGSLREHGEAAAEAGAWKKAQGTLDELQREFRRRRQDAVTGQMHAALCRMLPDAEVELAGIRHAGGAVKPRGVEVELTIGGREARLGMLSSGQRNALLLTPLVILDATGPFGFLVVDDPVHALDDMRVDLLAQELARLAQERQVIVLTHDPRLEEHLRARCLEITVIELHREPVPRTVTWTGHTTPWAALLEDARAICTGAKSDGWGIPSRWTPWWPGCVGPPSTEPSARP